MADSNKLPISVAIISFNEEENIGRTLDSVVDIASEIIVVDSGSSDRTRELAEGYGATVYEEDWKGHILQKNSALEKCGQEWILSLDCDEVLSDELRRSIVKAVADPLAEGYVLNRKTVYLGKVLEHAWQPDHKLRLVKRTSAPRWGGYDPHDVLSITGRTLLLEGDLFHYSYKDVRDHFNRVVHYSKLVAESYRKDERKFRLYNLLINPAYAFVKEYIIKMGIRDGIRGLAVAVSVATYTFLKYYYLWELEQEKE
ncbi:MAG: glycosyltransferase family 2 protein [Nitrospirota bacterium]|nr:MAG: glycosyltransferase family 2 protein [Nitrospirota bacterium]